jgi:hypothetical protein
MTLRDELTIFFQRLSDRPAESFAETFLAGDKGGIRPVTREAFLRALPKRAEMFREAGVGEPVLAELSFEALDEHYVLARTEWAAGPIRLVSSYLLHRKDDGTLEVVVYLNHQGFEGARA